MPRSNQVLQALDSLSRTVQGFGRNRSQHESDMARLGLMGARQDYDMGRQTAADKRETELFKSGASQRQLGTSRADDELKAHNAPITSATLMNSPRNFEWGAYVGKSGKTNIDRLISDLGYDSETDDRGVTHIYYPGTKEPITKGKEGRRLSAYLLGRVDLNRKARADVESDQRALAEGRMTPEEFNSGLAAKKEEYGDFETQLQKSRDRSEVHEIFKNEPWAQKNIAKEDARRRRLEDMIEKRRAALLKEKGANKRAGLGGGAKPSADIQYINYLAEHVTGGDRGEATDIFRNDRLMRDKLQVYASRLAILKDNYDFQGMPIKKQNAEILKLQVDLGIKRKAGTEEPPVGGRTALLPGAAETEPPLPPWKQYDK